MGFLPPTQELPLVYDRYEPCQLRYVFARELTRTQPQIGWYEAYQEAGEAVSAIQRSQTPLALGAKPGEVVWPVMICAANRWARLPSDQRKAELVAVSSGKPIWLLGASTSDVELCDASVLDDKEYDPIPPCVPREPVRVGAAVIASASWLIGVILTARALTEAER